LWGGRVEETARDFRVPESELRVMQVKPAELVGGDPVANAQIVHDVLGGKDSGPRRDIVLLNAAAALVVSEAAPDFAQGWQRAAQSIDSGAALEKLTRFIEASKRN
jgi:anthranilate phosphoribosyltransferase